MAKTMAKWVIFVTAISMMSCLHIVLAKQKSTSEIFEKEIMGKNNYDIAEPPRPNDKSVDVRIGAYLHSLQVDTKKMEFRAVMYMRQAWTDPRLQFHDENSDGETTLKLSPDQMEKTWRPDTFFRNSISARGSMTSTNSLLNIKSSGKVFHVQKINMKFLCPMKLHKFPFDTQSCPIMVESFHHSTDDLFLSWLPSPVSVDSEGLLFDFILQDHILYDCSQNYTAGAFPCLEIRFVLKRDSAYYIRYHYLPTMLLVTMSWLVFWMPVKATGGRLMLLLPIIWFLIYMCYSVMQDIPKLSYMTSIEIWNTLCMVMVLFAFMEMLVVHLIRLVCSDGKEGAEDGTGQEKRLNTMQSLRTGKAAVMDKICRLLFPSIFLIINIIYWTLYTI